VQRHWLGRAWEQFPFLLIAVLGVLIGGAVALGRSLGDGSQGVGVLPVLGVVAGVLVLLALMLDGTRLNARPTEWDGVVVTPAHEFERATSRYFAGEGWSSQRDDPDYKLFTRRSGPDLGTLIVLFILGVLPALLYLAVGGRSGQTVVTIEVYPVMEGTRVRLLQSRGDRSADRFVRELPRLEVAPGARDPALAASHVAPRRDPHADHDPYTAGDDRDPGPWLEGAPRADLVPDPYQDTRLLAGYRDEQAFRRDWPDAAVPGGRRRERKPAPRPGKGTRRGVPR
jgi:hypothetical protein